MGGFAVGEILGLAVGFALGVTLGLPVGLGAADGFWAFGVALGVETASVIPAVGVANIISNDGVEGSGEIILFFEPDKYQYPPPAIRKIPTRTMTIPPALLRLRGKNSLSIIHVLYTTLSRSHKNLSEMSARQDLRWQIEESQFQRLIYMHLLS